MRAPALSRRRRSPACATLVMIAVIMLLAAGCGSETAEPTEPLPEAGTSAPSPTVDGSAAAPVGPAETPVPAPTPVPDDAASQPSALPPPGPSPPSAGSPPPPQQSDTSGARMFPSGAVWEALRQCQSQGDYGFVHPSGEHFGAYQFTVMTWNRLAGQRYTELMGVLPSEAAPEDQDRMAYYLWIESGSAPWPACRHVFTGDLPPDEAVAPATAASPQPSEDADGGAAAAGESGSPPGEEASTPADGTPETTPSGETPDPETDPSLQPAIPPDVEGFPTPEQWEALRQCESSGNYRAVSRNGLYYGAYQFWPDTWNFVASRNYPRLINVSPRDATPQDQDRMAYRLWEERGDQPWPVCGRHLRPGA